MMPVDPRGIPAGALVHHRGGIYSVSFFMGGPDDLEGHDEPGQYWAVLHGAIPQRDGTFEYLVKRLSPPFWDETNPPTWWASYAIDRVVGLCSACNGTGYLAVDSFGGHGTCAVCEGSRLDPQWQLDISNKLVKRRADV